MPTDAPHMGLAPTVHTVNFYTCSRHTAIVFQTPQTHVIPSGIHPSNSTTVLRADVLEPVLEHHVNGGLLDVLSCQRSHPALSAPSLGAADPSHAADYSAVGICHNVFIHSSVNGRLHGLQFGLF